MWRRILRQQPSRNHLFIYIVPATPYFASFSFPFSPDISGSRDWPWYGPPVWKRRRRCSEQTCAARRPHPTSPATWPRPPRAPMILSYRISTGWRRHRPTTVERCGANDRQSAGRGPLAWHTGSRIEEAASDWVISTGTTSDATELGPDRGGGDSWGRRTGVSLHGVSSHTCRSILTEYDIS